MVFSSILFLLYFAPVFFLVYFLLPDKWKNGWVIISSLLFYLWGAPSFFLVFILSCAMDYYAVILFSKTQNKIYYFLGVAGNVFLLLYFKYYNFFIENVNEVLGNDIEWTKVALPIGISFLTFQKISYIIDVKREDCEPQKYFHQYLLYIALFPQLIAGPIVRYKEISDQLSNRFEQITSTNIYIGLRRFIIGLSKKVLIANVLGLAVDQIFSLNPSELSSYASIMGLLAYTFQIYFDFSGYSDMAIGLGKMMGFTFPENFNFPYIAKNITEFWRRWHITLSNWMRDYLYIPLGGNRLGGLRTYINLFVVFLISGLWHGASWNFVIWGAYHGFFLIIERMFLLTTLNKLPSVFRVIYCFSVVSMGWLLFRANSIEEAIFYCSGLISNNAEAISLDTIFTSKFYVVFVLAFLFSFMGVINEAFFEKINNSISINRLKLISSHVMIVLLLLLCLGEIFASGFNPFIYFRF
jgi:alginate O-acetyltransferase complex protein AlgI